MRRLKFFTLFRTLQPEEVAAFQKYLKRMHSNEKVALGVYAYVKKFYPGFQDEKKLDLSHIFRKVFGTAIEDNEYNRKKLLNALSDLNLWLKAFILSEKLNDNSFESRYLWLTILKERKMKQEFVQDAAQIQEELAVRSKRRSVTDYGQSLALNQMVYNQFAEDNSTPLGQAFLPLAANLDLYYAVTKIKMACELVNMQNQNQPVSEPGFLLEMPEIKETPILNDHPLVQLYSEIYRLLSSRRDEHYSRVEALLMAQAEKIDPIELGVMLIYLRNYGSSMVRKGEEQLWERVHRLNKLGVDNEVFIRRGTMTAREFLNIVNAAGKVGDFTWAEKFIRTRSRHLPADTRVHAELLARTILQFEQKDFASIVRELNLVNLKELHDLHLLIRLRTMMLRCFYELGKDQDTILTYCTNFENSLHRMHHPSTEAVVATFNFITLLKILIRKKTDKETLQKKIHDTQPVFFKPWLLEKTAGYKAEFATRKRSK